MENKQELSHNKLVKQVIKDVKDDMTDEQVIQMVLDKSVTEESIKNNKRTFGQKCSDIISKFAGSWAFVISFVVILFGWIITNIILAANAFDSYPFILLNLFLSCIAAIQAPILMMSQNRQDDKDRQRADINHKVNLKTEIIIKDLYEKINKISKRQEKIIKQLDNLGLVDNITNNISIEDKKE